jgi:hypothetical protein
MAGIQPLWPSRICRDVYGNRFYDPVERSEVSQSLKLGAAQGGTRREYHGAFVGDDVGEQNVAGG